MTTLFFTVRQWDRFSWSMQEAICKRYSVILTDHKTSREKAMLFLDKINLKNFNKGVDAFGKSVNQFSKTIDSLTESDKPYSFEHDIADRPGRVKFSKDAFWAKNVDFWGDSGKVSLWPEGKDKKMEFW
jgi:hypothetical protein